MHYALIDMQKTYFNPEFWLPDTHLQKPYLDDEFW